MNDPDRRDFLKLGGGSVAAGAVAAAALGGAGRPRAQAGAAGADASRSPTTVSAAGSSAMPPATPYPKLSIITRYSPAKLEFAARAGYEGVVIAADDFFDPDKLTDRQTEEILAAARNAGIRLISIERMWGYNHIDANPVMRRAARARFIRALEFAHQLGCKFVGTFSGGEEGASVERQAAELAAAFNEDYLPVCDKLDLTMGWENFPCPVNFATTPAAWNAVFARVPSPRLGLEFDPSHLLRQYIDPARAAWDVRDRILAVHAKDTEITEPVLQQVGILGDGWWRYRIPGQGRIDWPAFLTVLLQIGFNGGLAVEHEDAFWDGQDTGGEFTQRRKDGFLLAHRFLSLYLPGRLA